MTNADYTHFTILADRTGSMGAPTEVAGRTRATDTTTGIHELVNEQAKQPGKLTMSLVQFMASPSAGKWTSHIDRVAWMAAPQTAEWEKLRLWTCAPYGNTPLLDAIGVVITDTGAELAKLPENERPGKVLFVIATDGEENWSSEYTLESVKRMVKEQQDSYGWQFIFIGVDIDAFAEGGKIGFAAASTMGTAGSSAGMAATYDVLNSAAVRYRGAPGGQSVAFTTQERATVAAADEEAKSK